MINKILKPILRSVIFSTLILALIIKGIHWASYSDKEFDLRNFLFYFYLNGVLQIIISYSLLMKEDRRNNRIMKQNNWNKTVYQRLITLIKENGTKSEDYNTNNSPYAVFDFDNTSAIFDVQEALLLYQLENLVFKCKPEEMQSVLETGIPDVHKAFNTEFNNSENKQTNVFEVAKDISTAYTYLYNHYKGFNKGGLQQLSEIKNTSQYIAFITKVRFLYEAINKSFDASVGYPWVTYLFTGMTSEEIITLTQESNDFWLEQTDYKKAEWITPKEFPGVAGIVSVEFTCGLKFPKETLGLYKAFKDNGIGVYVCSASFIDVIKATVCNEKYGFNIQESNVYAMRLEKDSEGKYLNKFDTNYFQTQQEGKTKTINSFIRPKHKEQAPIFIAGDSMGDYDMLTSFPKLQLGLIIDRNNQQLEKLAKEDRRFVIQARNEKTASFIKDQKSIFLK